MTAQLVLDVVGSTITHRPMLFILVFVALLGRYCSNGMPIDNDAFHPNVRGYVMSNAHDEGQWYHMAQMTVPFLRILPERLNSPAVCALFKDSSRLNPMTRFLVTLSIAKYPQRVYFLTNGNYMREEGFVVDASKQPVDQRFVVSSTQENVVNSIGSCNPVKFATGNENNWADSDWTLFDRQVQDFCGPPSIPRARSNRRKLIVYQRDKTRRFQNVHVIVDTLIMELESSDWEVELLIHDDRTPPCSLAHLISTADAIVTPHGFQATVVLFMKPGAVLYEVFPWLFRVPGIYGTLASKRGVEYDNYMSPPLGIVQGLVLSLIGIDTGKCTSNKRCKALAKKYDVRLDTQGINRLMKIIAPERGVDLVPPSWNLGVMAWAVIVLVIIALVYQYRSRYVHLRKFFIHYVTHNSCVLTN